jgi:glycosyltransferase involved in cell wall biosynthesis
MRFTIAIPAYKLRFFEECLDSIFAQSYQDFELLILNDASPEDFDSAIAKYSDKRIQYLKNDKNCGAINVVDNWNKLLKMSTGDYIVMMGDDDKLHPDFLSTFNSLIEKYPQVDVFHARVTGIDEKSSPCYLALERVEYESPCTFILERFRRGTQFIGDFCIRRTKLLEIGGYAKFPLAWCSDDVTSFSACVPNGVVHTKEPLFYYRSSYITISSSKFNKEKLEAVLAERKWFEQFVKTYKPKDEKEKLLFSLVKKEYPKHISDKEALYFARHLAEKKSNLFHFNKIRKQYQISSETAQKTAFMALGHILKSIFSK